MICIWTPQSYKRCCSKLLWLPLIRDCRHLWFKLAFFKRKNSELTVSGMFMLWVFAHKRRRATSHLLKPWNGTTRFTDLLNSSSRQLRMLPSKSLFSEYDLYMHVGNSTYMPVRCFYQQAFENLAWKINGVPRLMQPGSERESTWSLWVLPTWDILGFCGSVNMIWYWFRRWLLILVSPTLE